MAGPCHRARDSTPPPDMKVVADLLPPCCQQPGGAPCALTGVPRHRDLSSVHEPFLDSQGLGPRHPEAGAHPRIGDAGGSRRLPARRRRIDAEGDEESADVRAGDRPAPDARGGPDQPRRLGPSPPRPPHQVRRRAQEQPLSARDQIHPRRRPARRHRRTRGPGVGGRPRPGPARRHRLGQDLHHGQGHRTDPAPGPDPGPQQDPRRPALFRVQELLPR